MIQCQVQKYSDCFNLKTNCLKKVVLSRRWMSMLIINNVIVNLPAVKCIVEVYTCIQDF